MVNFYFALQVCEHVIVHGLCSEYSDWSIAAAGSEKSVRIGYDYGRSVTGMEQVEINEDAVVIEDAVMDSDPSGVVATSTMVYLLGT